MVFSTDTSSLSCSSGRCGTLDMLSLTMERKWSRGDAAGPSGESELGESVSRHRLWGRGRAGLSLPLSPLSGDHRAWAHQPVLAESQGLSQKSFGQRSLEAKGCVSVWCRHWSRCTAQRGGFIAPGRPPHRSLQSPLMWTQPSWLLARCEWAELAGPAIPLRPVSSLERGHLIPEIQQGGFIETVPLKRAQNDGYHMFLNSSWSF